MAISAEQLGQGQPPEPNAKLDTAISVVQEGIDAFEAQSEALFQSDPRFEDVVRAAASELDEKKLYGIGSVLGADTVTRIRHLRKVANLDETEPADKLVGDFNKLLHIRRKKGGPRYEDTIPPHEVANAITFESSDERYSVVHAVALAMIQKDALIDDEHRLGPAALLNLNTMLVYAVDPIDFARKYSALVKATDG